MLEHSYKGIQNQGATCYMNSLLQTLFMTPQFRDHLYKYRYDPAKEGERQDSIPYQLQQLFIKLQESAKLATTKKLIKSFQWEEQDGWDQHDVQEFCRVLFDAVQSSSPEGEDWIKKLYEGTIKSVIRCENGHKSQRFETFMDLSLTIKDPFQNADYNNLESALKGYLKVDELSGTNQYDCEMCGKKVNAKKGLQLASLPPILTIQMKRFQLNYDTMQREKINQFVYFPQILHMDEFMKPYEEMKQQELPKGLEQWKQTQLKPNSRNNLNMSTVEIPTKGRQARATRKKSEDKIREVEEKVSFVDESAIGKPKNEVLTEAQKKERNIQFLRSLKLEKDTIDTKYKKVEHKIDPSLSDAVQLTGEQLLFGVGVNLIMDAQDDSEPVKTHNMLSTKSSVTETPVPNNQATQTQTPTVKSPAVHPIIEEETYSPQKQYPKNTYRLYAVLVHSGGAFRGHYYAYIHDGQGWYQFNDERVSRASRQDIRKYGSQSGSTQGASAYMLFYKRIQEIDAKKLEDVKAPEELVTDLFLEQQIETIKESEKQAEDTAKLIKRMQELKKTENSVKIKVYTNNVDMRVISDLGRHDSTLYDLRQRVKKMFDIKHADHNWRFRRYNHYQDTMLEAIPNDATAMAIKLADLNFKDQVTLIVESKQDSAVFEEYDPRAINLKINVWRQGLTLLSESFLKPVTLKVKDDSLFKDTVKKIREITNLKNPVIIKRTFATGKNAAFEVVSNAGNMMKTLLSMRFFNSLNLYVQPEPTTPGAKYLWENEFESEKHRFLVKFNNPNNPSQDAKQLQFYFDNRKTFMELKQTLARKLNIEVSDFRVKKSNVTQPEIIEYKKRLLDLKMVHSQNLFIELGRSAKGLVSISKGHTCDYEDGIEYIRNQAEDYQMEDNQTVFDLKASICEKNSLGTIPHLIRIRELKYGRFGQVFSDDTRIEKILKVSLIWEQLAEEPSRGISVYVRKLNADAFTLDKTIEVYVDHEATYQEMAYILSDEAGIPVQELYAYRVTDNMFELAHLKGAHFQNLHTYDGKIVDPPLYLSTDGEFLIVKQGLKLNYVNKTQVLGGAFTYNPKDVKQKALKITVKKQTNHFFFSTLYRKQEKPATKQEQKPQETTKPQPTSQI